LKFESHSFSLSKPLPLPIPDALTFYTLRCTYVEETGMNIPGKFDLPQGTLDLLIMRVVSLGPIHGYALAQRIQQMSREALQVQQGSLYPALHRLEYKKFLKATWKESETGREAKFYELTVQGRAHLKAETENWNRLTDVVGLILKGTLEGIS
jgi:PadR family transcriptional regulator, regulatory protein PadR